jgi:hypothetical protein
MPDNADSLNPERIENAERITNQHLHAVRRNLCEAIRVTEAAQVGCNRPMARIDQGRSASARSKVARATVFGCIVAAYGVSSAMHPRKSI